MRHDSKKLQDLISAFQKAEEQVRTAIIETPARTVKEYEMKLDKKLSSVSLSLTKKAMSWAEQDMPKAYKEGARQVDGRISALAAIDETDISNTYIQLARNIKHATDTEQQAIREAIEKAERENKYGATVSIVKDIIQEELKKNNLSMVVTYSNGAKMPLSAHSEMLARTSRIIASNTGSFDRCKELGIDLVRCTTVPNCCPYCKKFEGKVYSISGKDTRFPALYETALAKGYNIMHPNCRHEFIPFAEEMQTAEELKKLIEDSNHFEKFTGDEKLFDIYKRDQAFHRQLVDESREFHRWKSELGDEMPYSTLRGFRNARRTGSTTYKKIHYRKRDEKLYEEWKNVIGEDNMPKTLENFQEIRYNKNNQYRALQFEVQKGRIVKKIGSDELPLNIQVDKQGKHIKGAKTFDEDKRKSYLSVESVEEGISLSNELVQKYHGTGQIKLNTNGVWNNRERVVSDRVVGFVLNKNGEWVKTNCFTIHYSKNGTHIVPTIIGE